MTEAIEVQQSKQPQLGFNELPLVMSVDELAELVGTSRNGIAELIRNGSLKAFDLFPGGRPKYRLMRDDVIEWLTRTPVKPIRSKEAK